MNGNDTLRLFLIVIAIFIGLLFKPQIQHWWERRKRMKEAEQEAKLNRELDQQGR